ncbi:hypothetical protein JRO89_XS07G0036200 [Xanthoceras sorbifolium]|uniref:Uncharacterized protein n=1 Tax=Xanthoceras sorbifolium TaxID=99658 RepID=A0ABQ8HS93_9ROSI|nr:hypothetical protein JRO89_XS07G0036200 [Xanthoceras sorbifolium]
MSSSDFNNVKAEKAAAMRSYNQQKKLKSFLFLVEVFVALALLLWYSTYYVPVAADVARDFLRRSAVVSGRSLYVFVITNVLVVVIFFLSRQKPTKPDFYDEYVSITTTTVPGRRVDSTAAEHTPAPDESVTPISDRQIVSGDNAVHNPHSERSVVRAATATASADDRDPEPILAASVRQSGAGAATETKRYRRTRSERFGKESRPELRRSETTIAAAVGREPERRSSSAMDDLSNEEFRMTIETFIAAKKKSLIRENTLDLKLERKDCVSITFSRIY